MIRTRILRPDDPRFQREPQRPLAAAGADGVSRPRDRQAGGQAMGRPGIVVKGVRPKIEGQEVDVYGNWQRAAAAK
jgi:hypothetical protein